MVFSVEQAKPGLHTPVPQGRVHLDPLRHGAAIVLVGVDEEGGGLCVLHIFQRGQSPELFRVVVDVSVTLVPGKVEADVRHAVEAEPVGDGPLGGGAAEPVRVADDPVGHKAAVAAAGLADPGRVDLGVLGQHRVGEVHQVDIIRVPVVAPDVHEHVVPAVAAHGVAEEDEVAQGGPNLHLMVEDRAVDGLGAPVDVQHRGVFLGGIEVSGLQNPALDLPAPALDVQNLGLRHILALQGGVVEVGDSGEAAVCPVVEIELLGPHVEQTHQQKLVSVHVEAVHGPVPDKDRCIAAVGFEQVDLGVALPGGQVPDAGVGLHGLTSAAQAAVRAHGVVEVLFLLPQQGDRAVGGVQGVDPGVLVETVAFALGGHQQDGASGDLHGVGPQGGMPRQLPDRAGLPVDGPEGEALQGVFVPPGGVGQQDLVAQNGLGDQILRHLQQGLDLEGLPPHQEGQGPAAVGDALPVAPEGQLVKDLVIRLLCQLLAQGSPALGVELPEIRVPQVGLGDGQEAVFIQDPQAHHREGEGHIGQSLSAPKVQTVVGGEEVLGLGPLFLRGGADSREDQPVLVQPDEAALLAQVRELPQAAVLIEPEPPLIVVLL